MRHNFYFGGVGSSTFGIYISGTGTYSAPAREYEHITIPGKDGDVLSLKSRLANIEVPYKCFMFADSSATFEQRLRNFRTALLSKQGYQELEDTYHTDEFRLGILEASTEIEPVAFHTAAEFELVFNCKPQRFLNSGVMPQTLTISRTAVTADITLTNSEYTTAKPLITITFSANAAHTATVEVINENNDSWFITCASVAGDLSSKTVTIDCETGTVTASEMTVVYGSGSATTESDGKLPELIPGETTFTLTKNDSSGSTSYEATLAVTPRWWRL